MSSVKDLLRGDVVDGSGTANYVSKWSDADTITNSVVYDDGTNVGIGTTSPSTKLHILSSNPTINLESNNPSVINGIDWIYSGIGKRAGITVDYTTGEFKYEVGASGNSYYKTFYTNGSERMRITSDGDIHFRKDNAIALLSNPDNFGAIALGAGDGGSGTLIEPHLVVQAGGNVGIGTSSPGVALDVRGGNSANIRMGSTSTSLGNLTDIGSLEFFNSDAQQNAVAASIKGIRGASFGSGGYLTFFTSAAGNPAGALTQKMQIDTLGNIGAPSGSNIYNASDARLKQNIVSIANGLDTICNLNPVKFNWIEGFSESEQGKDMLGFVAQEVQQVLPEAVEDFANNTLNIGDTTIDNPLRVNEKFIIPVLVKAIQELKAEIELLKSQK